jgi:undecaprenyl-diphosphatase
LSILHAIILGLVQGISEFLPISSSGHLILVREVLGWNFGPEKIEKTFDVALHLGTFFGLAIYFWKDIGRLARGFFRAIVRRSLSADPYSKLALLILVSTLPAAIAGVKFDSLVEEKLGTPLLICGLLVAFGLLLWLADWKGKRLRALPSLGWRDAVIIGLAQALALAPGASRSGVTMTAGLGMGLNRETAARFSFLISLPVIAGAALYKGAELARQGMPPGLEMPMIAGVIAAAISGFIAIFWLLRFLQTHSLRPFVYYRLAAGVGLIVFFLTR